MLACYCAFFKCCFYWNYFLSIVLLFIGSYESADIIEPSVFDVTKMSSKVSLENRKRIIYCGHMNC